MLMISSNTKKKRKSNTPLILRSTSKATILANLTAILCTRMISKSRMIPIIKNIPTLTAF